MKAIVQDTYGSPNVLKLREIDKPNVGDNEALVRVHAARVDRALRFAHEIQAGYVMINEYFTGGMGSPFGGYKQSGIGRERGLVALDNYTQIKNVVARVR
jgi:acyl-CoA reductase-like NAD-dependent aldehyde dehydrogenase